MYLVRYIPNLVGRLARPVKTHFKNKAREDNNIVDKLCDGVSTRDYQDFLSVFSSVC